MFMLLYIPPRLSQRYNSLFQNRNETPLNKHIRIGLCQHRPTTGAIEENTAAVLQQLDNARKQQVNLVVFPELFLSGYPPEDLLFRSDSQKKIASACQQLVEASTDVSLLVGLPWYENNCIYNAMLFCHQGKAEVVHKKKALPNYSVFDERRYFAEGTQETVIDLMGLRCLLSICEEVWVDDMAQRINKAQADLVISIHGSPFYLGKKKERTERIQNLSRKTKTAICYVNLSSCQDELVFDGGSFITDSTGDVIANARHFVKDEIIFDIYPNKKIVANRSVLPEYSEEQQLFLALTTSLREYVDNNRFKGVLIGLSGGIDSALVLVLACAAIGADRVQAVMMPYIYTSLTSLEDARQQAQNCRVEYQEISIEKMVHSFLEVLPCDQTTPEWQTTLQNIQARCRGLLLMALSNYSGNIVLATGNKSEMAVGYATLYGDMAGGFAPVKDVDKTTVYRLARFCNSEREIIPERIITKAPSAELLPDQKDSDNLPEYSVLDEILSGYIEQNTSVSQLETRAKKEDVSQVLAMVDRNEYKRKQAAIGTKVTRLGFGKDRRMPITQSWQHT